MFEIPSWSAPIMHDKAHECSESIDEKNEKLLKMFGPELEPHLVFHKGVTKMLFPLNTIHPEWLDRHIAGMIRVAVEVGQGGEGSV